MGGHQGGGVSRKHARASVIQFLLDFQQEEAYTRSSRSPWQDSDGNIHAMTKRTTTTAMLSARVALHGFVRPNMDDTTPC